MAATSPWSTSVRKKDRIEESLRAMVRGACAAARELGGVAAQQRVADLGGREPLGVRPAGQLAEIGAVGDARALGGAVALQVAVEQPQGRAPWL